MKVELRLEVELHDLVTIGGAMRDYHEPALQLVGQPAGYGTPLEGALKRFASELRSKLVKDGVR